jgi:heme oxygenase
MTLAENLKASTRTYHDSAEGHDFQRYLAQALLPLDQYRQYLEQLYLVHSTLERNIKEKREQEPRLTSVVLENQMQERFLQQDLAYLKSDQKNITALPATLRLLKTIDLAAGTNAIALLGFHYVLLGSKHGGKFIAKSVREKYQFTSNGANYFDPYGDQFMTYWRTFINAINEIPVSKSDTIALIEAAQATFIGIGEIGSELEQHSKEPV